MGVVSTKIKTVKWRFFNDLEYSIFLDRTDNPWDSLKNKKAMRSAFFFCLCCNDFNFSKHMVRIRIISSPPTTHNFLPTDLSTWSIVLKPISDTSKVFAVVNFGPLQNISTWAPHYRHRYMWTLIHVIKDTFKICFLWQSYNLLIEEKKLIIQFFARLESAVIRIIHKTKL